MDAIYFMLTSRNSSRINKTLNRINKTLNGIEFDIKTKI